MAVRKRRDSIDQETILRAREAELMHTHHPPEGAGHVGASRTTQATSTDSTTELHVCLTCGSDLVYPVDWAPAAPRQWSVKLRCPDCESHREGVFDQNTVDRFDEVLDDGSQAILDDLTKLSHANMSDDIERFVVALRDDLVLPEDF
jgi:hypothetical protein